MIVPCIYMFENKMLKKIFKLMRDEMEEIT
jgi:hypothetical protein